MSDLEQLESLLANNIISRREFIAHASAMGLMAEISPTLLAELSHAVGSQQGGRLKTGLPGKSTTVSLAPCVLTDTAQFNLNWEERNTLIDQLYKTKVNTTSIPNQKER